MNHLKGLIITLLLSLTFSLVPQYPIIGIYTQIDEYDQPSTKQWLSTYISAAYVKYVWMSGAQVVPIYAFSNQSDIQILLRQINGVLFTGGAGEDQIHIDNRWVKNANFIVQWAMNQNKNGNPFPVWGTCLGFELFTYITSNFNQTVLQPIDASDHYINTLSLQQPSYLYGDLDSNLKKKLTTSPGILYFNHEDALKETTFRNNKYLSNFWKLTSLSKSRASQSFVSTIQAKDYPFYACQYHPQKNIYEWKVFADRSNEGALISQILSNKFVEIARKNTNRFASDDVLTKSLIYNFKTGPTTLPYQMIYPFKQPRPSDWPYSSTK